LQLSTSVLKKSIEPALVDIFTSLACALAFRKSKPTIDIKNRI